MHIVIVGHVDHGKSTVIGKLLADTGSLPDGKLEQIKEMCRRNSKPFEYAFLLDALKDERTQGITIDTARCFFKTDKRQYIIIDAPGHIEFLKNMITGAARAQAALLVIDAFEGIAENSRRHGYILAMLGIKQVSVLVNKMDLINYDEKIYNDIVKNYSEFLSQINITPKSFIPISATQGDNIATISNNMSWYTNGTVLDILDNFDAQADLDHLPARLPVQDVYKFTSNGDDRRIIAGTLQTGTFSEGDEIVFYPSGKKTKIKSIEGFNQPKITTVKAGYATGFTMTEQIYVKRGEIAVKTIESEKKPYVATLIHASIFWLGRENLEKNKQYILKIGSSKVTVTLEKINSVLNASSLEKIQKEHVERHEVADCILRTEKPIAFDKQSDIALTSRFVLIDKYEISGGGIILESLEDNYSDIRDMVLNRNFKWEKSAISTEKRAEKNGHLPAVVFISGSDAAHRKNLAKSLEEKLFFEGRNTYYMGIGNILYGIDADIKTNNMSKNHINTEKEEHFRRLGETANILLDTGLILIITAADLTQPDIDLMQTIIDIENVNTVWIGENSSDIKNIMLIKNSESIDQAVIKIKNYLQDQNIIFKPF